MEGPDVFPFLLIFREEVDCLGLVLDFAFFAVLLVCIIVAAKRGFVLSLMELVGFFLAGACALSLSGLIAPEIYDRFFAQQVTQAIAARLPDLSGAATAAQQAHAALESLPDVIAQFAASLGIDTAALAQKILSADLSGAALAQTLADSIARPLVTLLCRLALFVGLILIFGILFRILAAVIDRFFHLPVLRTANAALGGVFAVLFYQGHVLWAVFVLFLSGLSDFFDGKIARRFHQVSALGKVLDPVADKITQITIAVMLFLEFHKSTSGAMRAFSWVFLFFLCKEGLMILGGAVMLAVGLRPGAAEIYGKVATFAFYGVMLAIIAFGPGFGAFVQLGASPMPDWMIMILVVVSAILTLVALISYLPETFRQFRDRKKPQQEPPQK